MGSEFVPDEGMDEVLQEFVSESREHLADIEANLLVIEEGGADIDEVLVNKVFRAAHSIKGASGFFGFGKIKELAHKAETVLDMVRSRKMAPNAEVTNVLLAAFDRLRDMINDTKTSELSDIQELVANLSGLASSYLPASEKPSLKTQVTVGTTPAGAPVTLPQTDLDRVARDGNRVYWVDCDLVHDVEKKGLNVMSLFRDLEEAVEVLDCAVDFEGVGTLDDPVGNRVPLRLVIATGTEPDKLAGFLGTLEKGRIRLLHDAEEPPKPAVSVQPEARSAPEPSASVDTDAGQTVRTETAVEDSIRVNVGLLETLMNLAGELVLSRNQLRAAVAENDRQLLTSADQRVNQVTSELQDVIMQTRMQPIGNVLSKFPRLVRDLSRTLGKEIQLEIEGKDVALDKTLIEGLSDPLTHMVRNSVDHGVETPDVRLRAGKKSVGTVRIDARHEAGQVIVEISDDGKGIDPERVAEAAIRKGLITPEKVKGLSMADKQALILLPGLSTATAVSDVSGRGVGMDVVKTNLDRLGGLLEIDSKPGKGSVFRIKLPLTLAIIPSLIVSVGDERFAVPQSCIEELVRLRPEDLKSRVEIIGDSEVLLLRDRMLPIARLAAIVGMVPAYANPASESREIDRRTRIADRRSRNLPLDVPDAGIPPAGESARRNDSAERRHTARSMLEILVLGTGTMSYGLVVDSFHDTEEVVVKPLGGRLRHLKEYSGATILGNGTVALILDPAGISAKAGFVSVSGSARAAQLAAAAEGERLQDIQSLLMFNGGSGEPCAISLDLIQRIERIDAGQLETLGNQRTMQYRGTSLPLVALSDLTSAGTAAGTSDLVVLVSNVAGHDVGLLGAMPVDVVETSAAVDRNTHRQKGISGSAIIQGRTTLLVDLFELTDSVYPDWSAKRSAGELAVSGAKAEGITVLLAEDSDFFRNQMKQYLEKGGLTVLDAADGEAAWELLLENLAAVRVVVTDIEMPRLGGLELTARIRADKRTAALPVIAVTSLAGEEDAERGLAAGISEYQVKIDRDKLLSSVRSRALGV